MATDKTTNKEEEKKEEIPQNPQNKVKLDFKVNREQASKTEHKEHKYTLEEVEI